MPTFAATLSFQGLMVMAFIGAIQVGAMQIDAVQVVSLVGAMLQLVVYALMQLERLSSDSYPYQWANVIGSFLMTIVATINHEYGFILMEAVWCLTSAYGLVRLIRSRADGAPVA